MDKFLKYFEDKQFIQWVLNPDESLNKYWDEFIIENPEEKKRIQLARILIESLKTKKEPEEENEAALLYAEIIQKLGKRKNRNLRKSIVSFMKYAAVGIFFFTLGIATYNYYQKPDKFDDINRVLVVQNPDDAQLILGNGKNISIAEKESNIKYDTNGKIVINNKDTVQNYSDSQENELNQLVVPYGKNSSIKLPDGTIAYLNAGSRLIYPSFFDGKTKEVFLFGEGYFEVNHDPDRPFIVKTKELVVEALGTKFNLSAYASDKIIETVLLEGKVRINETRFHLLKNEYILEPNQKAAFDRESNEIKITQVDVMNYVAWHEGYLNFDASDLNRVIKKIERYYKIQINLEDPMLGVKKITGKLELIDDQEKVLNVLAKTASAELIKINNSTYMIK